MPGGQQRRRHAAVGASRSGMAARALLERQARVALSAPRPAPPAGRALGSDDGREGVDPVEHEVGDAVAVVDVERWQDGRRRGARHRTTQQQHGVVRLALRRRAVVRRQRRVPLGGEDGQRRARPGRAAAGGRRRGRTGCRPGWRTGRRCGSRRRGSRSRGTSVRTCRAWPGVVVSHGPCGPRATTPERGDERTAPSRPPADSALSMCLTGRASFRASTDGSVAAGARAPGVERLQSGWRRACARWRCGCGSSWCFSRVGWMTHAGVDVQGSLRGARLPW